MECAQDLRIARQRAGRTDKTRLGERGGKGHQAGAPCGVPYGKDRQLAECLFVPGGLELLRRQAAQTLEQVGGGHRVVDGRGVQRL